MHIVRIGDGSTKTHAAETIGAKAANLARMAALGLPVPPAFVLPVALCAAIVDHDPQARRRLDEGLAEGIAFLEEKTGTRLGDRRRPLLVSVRSGAARSMPGMLDTVLDVGCTPAAVQGLVRATGHPRFAWDCRRRLLESFGSVVLGIDEALFARRRADMVAAEGAGDVAGLDNEALERLAESYRGAIEDTGTLMPEDPIEQLRAAALAVYRSWTSERAATYRRLEHLEYLEGTAVTVQAMVFGNRSLSSGSGVAFSRDPSSGAARPMIDVLFEAQGEDVVSGSRTPETEEALERSLPDVARQLRETLARLERAFADVQDVEFTIEQGRLWLLQTRTAKRTPLAALRIATDLVREGVITPDQALARLKGLDLATLANRRLTGAGQAAGHGTGASAGVAVGRAAFESESAARLAADGQPVILLRPDTSTADVAGFAASAGIVTAVGGRTAHAALVARQMGKPCIVGCAGLVIEAAKRQAHLGDALIAEGDWLSIDGAGGTIHLGRAEVMVDRPDAEVAEVERWRAGASHKHKARAGGEG
ncbi:PEP/pyruvate-binding domain-containing protein [Labrys monachus]|uniref:Pyruvate,orthophosphate dikinase n=1 Tax=Labrys monachus TaxID=217067 RepID=A0ABU0FQA9_9HYPH|nr:PEP/pyruvate-binding domain-containing protein [Labrys monachus]MDQ0396243.1 pyruvate,orthophosphate dikinase [Labrys monachus]